jgi:hypothetical protein
VQGFEAGTPRLAFLRKGRDVVSVTGEKVHLNQLQGAVHAAAGRTGLAVWQFRLVPDVEACRHDLLVEWRGAPPGDGRARAFLAAVDEALGRLNVEYAGKRASRRLGPPRLHDMRPGWAERQCRADFARGRRDPQHKWAAIAPAWDPASRGEVVRSLELPESGASPCARGAAVPVPGPRVGPSARGGGRPVSGAGERAAGAPARLEGLGTGRILAGGVGFLALTAAALWWQFGRAPAGAPPPAPAGLRWGYLALLLLAVPVESLAGGTRLWLICRVLQPGVAFRTCLQAEWANAAVSLLTPSQSGGGPGQMYLLARGGVRVATALSASLLSFVGTLAGLVPLGVYAAWASGIGPGMGRVFAGAVAALAGVAGVIAVAALRPDALRAALGVLSRTACRASRRPELVRDWWPPAAAGAGPPADRMDALSARLADLAHAYRDDMALVWRRGKPALGAVGLLSLVFLAARAVIPFLCARFLGVEGLALRPVLEAQAALIFLVFFAPSPGGAGIAEAASAAMMADLVPAAYAPYYTLLWRTATAYLAALAGLVCLARALSGDARRALARALRAGAGARAGRKGAMP